MDIVAQLERPLHVHRAIYVQTGVRGDDRTASSEPSAADNIHQTVINRDVVEVERLSSAPARIDSRRKRMSEEIDERGTVRTPDVVRAVLRRGGRELQPRIGVKPQVGDVGETWIVERPAVQNVPVACVAVLHFEIDYAALRARRASVISAHHNVAPAFA